MNKVYLLLRNNKQSGPHTLEELLKFGLKPLDLIWIEGKRFGSSYPSAINALTPYVSTAAETTVPQAAAKKSDSQASPQINNKAYMPAEQQTTGSTEPIPARKVFVSMPANTNRVIESKKQDADTTDQDQVNTIEQKAEELRKRMQSYIPKMKVPANTEEPVITKYSSTIPEREEEYTSWIYNQKVNKSKKISEVQKQWAAIAVAALLILAVGFGISQYHNDKKETVVAASSEASDPNKSVPEPLITEPEPTSTRPITENNVANDAPADISSETTRNFVNNTGDAKKPVKEIHKAVLIAEVAKKNPVNKTPDKKTQVDVPVTETKKDPQEVKTAPKKEAEPVADKPKKKKTLNEKIDAFFSKFNQKKEQAPVVDNAPARTGTNTFPGTNERKAVHRDDKPVATSPTPSSTNLADYVEVTTNKPSENWMLGVHGLKVSLHNTGNETVKTAEVELRYYTEQNEVLDKKIVNFNNILPGKTVTLPAPDHRLADHADFRLVTAK